MTTLDLFLSDWASSQRVSTTWPSDVVASFDKDAEERLSLTTKPRRIVNMLWKATNRNQAARMLMQLLRVATESIEVPLYADQAVLVSMTATVLTVRDATNRRLHVGFKIAVISPDLGTVVRGEIASTTATTITVTAGMTIMPAGSLVFPVLDTLPMLGHSMAYNSDELQVAGVRFREVLGNAALPSLVPTFGDLPSGFPTISGHPVLNIDPNWASPPSAAIARSGSSFPQGKGHVVEVGGLKPIMKFFLEFSALTRAEAFSLLEFFDSRRGRCLPFWILSPHTVFRATTDVGATVEIEALENLIDIQDFVSWIAVEEVDGTIHIEALGSVASLSPTVWELTPTVAFPAIPLADIVRVTTGHLVRFTSDILEEDWNTDELATITMSVTELVNEQTIEVVDL